MKHLLHRILDWALGPEEGVTYAPLRRAPSNVQWGEPLSPAVKAAIRRRGGKA